MKKHILALIALATTTIFCLTACGKLTPEEETVQLSNKLTKILPKKAQDWKLGKIAPTVDKLGVNAEFNLISRNIIADSIQPGQLDETFTAGFQSLFCEGKKINSKMEDFVENGHYINFAINDYKNANISNIKFDKEFCSKNSLNSNSLDLLKRQEKQGFYDEEYLSTILVPATKKSFPIAYNEELVMADITAGPGSKLDYIITYTPAEKVTDKDALELANDLLTQITSSVCKDPSFKNLSARIDLITYHVTMNGKDILTKSVKKGCKIN
jgi:hypothetical protein